MLGAVLELDQGSAVAKKPRGGRGAGRHHSPRIAFHLPQWMDDGLRALARQDHRTLTAEVLIALRDFLAQRGIYDPEADQADQGEQT